MEARKLKNLLQALKEAGVSKYVYKDSECSVCIELSDVAHARLPEYEAVHNEITKEDLEKAEFWSS